ncbi:MAG: choice-of-anchor L domain-containing protein, partial [Bacteroidota bacterium]
MKNKIFLILSLILIQNYSLKAQIVIDNTVTPLQMVQNIAGAGVTIGAVSYTGSPLARGSFNGTSNLGITSGILLFTGDAAIVPVANTSANAGVDLSLVGDNDLDNLTSNTTYDACVLEFDFTPTSDSISFRYVFASEEYPEYVCSNYNDVFAFMITGPNPSGAAYNKKNIALIPGTVIPVAINSVNPGVEGSNAVLFNPCPAPNQTLSYSSLYFDNTGGANVMFDGFTVPLVAKCAVVPCASYHIKLAIADVGDGIYDSGVFIEANSLTGGQSGTLTATSPVCIGANSVVDITPGAASYVWNFDGGVATPPGGGGSHNVNWATSGTKNISCTATFGACPVVVTTQVIVNVPPTVSASANPAATCGGSSTLTATGGTGFVWSSVPASTIASTASPVVTPAASTTYTVTVTDANGCTNTASTSVTVNSSATIVASANPTAVCPGGSTTISCTSVPGASYSWSTGQIVSSFTDAPNATTTYNVTVSLTGCTTTSSATVTVRPLPAISAGNDGNTCPGIAIGLTATGGASYEWSSPSLPANLLTPTISVSPTSQSTYTVTGTDVNGCSNID